MSFQESALYSDLVLHLRDQVAQLLSQLDRAADVPQYRARLDELIRAWLFAPQQELQGESPRDIIWRERRRERNVVSPERLETLSSEGLLPVLGHDCGEWHWTYAPESSVVDAFDPAGADAFYGPLVSPPTPPALPPAESHPQQLHLELLCLTQHNLLDGEAVAGDLLAMRDRWVSVLVDNEGMEFPGDGCRLVKLRDLGKGHYNADTLYVLTRTRADADTVAANVARWKADSVTILSPEQNADALGGAEGLWLVILRWE